MDRESASAPSATSGDDAFRTLALRLLAEHMLFMGGRSADQSQAQLLVGQVAPEFPTEIPFPDGSQVAGTLVRGREVQVILDVDLPLERIEAFYSERLPAIGWSTPGVPGPSRGGFVMTGPVPPFMRILFCRADGDSSLGMIAAPREGRPADVRLSWTRYDDPDQSPCGQRAHQPRGGPMGRDMWDRMPALHAPRGARQEGGGASFGGDSFSTSATLTGSGLDPTAVGQHYHDQLAQAGWTSTSAGAAPPAAWSTWTFPDEDGEPWAGVLLALQLPTDPTAPDRYLLTLHADAVRPGRSARSGNRFGTGKPLSFG